MMSGSADDKDLYSEAMAAILECQKKGIGKTGLINRYNDVARKYDQYSETLNYNASDHLAKAMTKLFPCNRDVITILDVASGTGLGGQAMWKVGFRQIDAVDPSEGMLTVAKGKKVYRRLICDFVDNEHNLDIIENTYDAVTILGGMAENHLPIGAFHEIIRVVKPGGVVVNVTRTVHLTTVDDYRNKLDPLFRKLEDDRKWREESRTLVPSLAMNEEGIIIVHRVMS